MNGNGDAKTCECVQEHMRPRGSLVPLRARVCERKRMRVRACVRASDGYVRVTARGQTRLSACMQACMPASLHVYMYAHEYVHV